MIASVDGWIVRPGRAAGSTPGSLGGCLEHVIRRDNPCMCLPRWASERLPINDRLLSGEHEWHSGQPNIFYV